MPFQAQLFHWDFAQKRIGEFGDEVRGEKGRVRVWSCSIAPSRGSPMLIIIEILFILYYPGILVKDQAPFC